MKKNNVTEAILYGSLLALLVILLIFSKGIRKRLLQGDTGEGTVTTEYPSREDAIRQNISDIPEASETSPAEQPSMTEAGFDPASITTEVMDNVPEASEPDKEQVSEEAGNPEGPQPASEEQTEEPYDGENNF